LFRAVIPRLREIYANQLSADYLINEFVAAGEGEILRYLAGPPVSSDDMATLVDFKITRAAFKQNPAIVGVINGIISGLLDQRRFPWIGEKREPTGDEIERAVHSSSTLLASQRVQTDRRGRAKQEQETLVKMAFLELGYKQAKAKPIRLITDAPDPLHFCGSTPLGGKQGDVYVRLPDMRLLAIECKVSNSEVNSFKRVMNDSLSKAHEWRRTLGEAQVIPALVLRGVFKAENLLTAQRDMFLIWDHRISDLSDFAKEVGS